MLELSHKKQRAGLATSSEFHKLMGIKGLGKTGDTYAFEKAVEIVFGVDEDDNYESYDMAIGTEREPLAFDFFKEKIKLEFGTVELCDFIQLGLNTGGTPDGKVNSKYPLETKCPKSNKYFSILRYGLDAIDEDWLIQLNHQMLIMNVEKGYFNLFTIYNGLPYHHYYEIERNMEMTTKMVTRLEEWVKLRDEHVAALRSKLC